jgi:hypothetical protein
MGFPSSSEKNRDPGKLSYMGRASSQGRFRSLRFHSITNRLILRKKPIPETATMPRPYGAESNQYIPPLVGLVREDSELLTKYEGQVVQAMESFFVSTHPQDVMSADRSSQELGLVPALHVVDRQKEIERILDEVQSQANSSQSFEEQLQLNVQMAQTLANVDAVRAEAAAMKALAICQEQFSPGMQANIIPHLCRTLARVGTENCVEQVIGLVNGITIPQQKAEAIICAAPELSSLLPQYAQLPIDSLVPQYTNVSPANLPTNLCLNDQFMNTVDIRAKWWDYIENMPRSVMRPYAASAVACMPKQFGRADDAVDLALHYCRTDLQNAEEQLQLLETTGKNAILSCGSREVQAVLNAQKEAQAAVGIPGTTPFQFKAALYLGRHEAFSNAVNRIQTNCLREHPRAASELSQDLFKLEAFDRAQEICKQIPSDLMRVETLTKSSALLLSDGKRHHATQLFNQTLDASNYSPWLITAVAVAAITPMRYLSPRRPSFKSEEREAVAILAVEI